MKKENRTIFSMRWLRKEFVSGLTTIFLFSLVLSIGTKTVNAQDHPDQIKHPSFFQPDEEAKKVFNDRIYLAQKKGEKRKIVVYGEVHFEEKSKVETSKLYFTDGQGKILNTFNIYPNSNVHNCQSDIRFSKKYLSIRRTFRDGKKEVLDGFVFNNEGTVLWHVPKEDVSGYIFPCDKTESVLTIDDWKGHLINYDINGVEKNNKYFSDQNDEKFPDLATPDSENAAIWGGCASSDDGNYVAVARSSNDIRNFQNELTLINSTGKVIFQNKDNQSLFNSVLKVYEDPNLIVLWGKIKGMPSMFKHDVGHHEYFGFDFTGKLLWKVDGEKYYIDPTLMNSRIVSLSEIDNTNGKTHLLQSNLTLNVSTGEIK